MAKAPMTRPDAMTTAMKTGRKDMGDSLYYAPRSQAPPGNAVSCRLCLRAMSPDCWPSPGGGASRAVRSQAEPGNETLRLLPQYHQRHLRPAVETQWHLACQAAANVH